MSRAVPDSMSAADLTRQYEQHGASAYQVAYRVVHDRELAIEAVQEAFLSVWVTRNAYRPERGEFGPWLHTVVHHRAVDIIRRRAAGLLTLPLHEWAAERIACQDPGPEDQACTADQIRRLRTAIRQLDPAKRQCLVMAYVAGHSHTQIAVTLDLPLGTVKTRIRRAKQDLHLLLADQ